MNRLAFAIVAVAAAALLSSAGGREASAGPSPALAAGPSAALAQESPCNAEEHRQFDFWIGDWEVRVVGTDRLAGTNEITPILGGCVLHESYSTPTGYAGESFNAYDRATGRWHQTWVDNSGLVLRIDGGLDEEGRMVLEGPGVDEEGNRVLNRIVWSPDEDGSVRQTWTMSADGGDTWTTAFDGVYRPRR